MRKHINRVGKKLNRKELFMATPGCWVDIFEDEDFQDSTLRVEGPSEHRNLKELPNSAGKDWGDQIDSLITGPNCWLTVYEDENFGDRSVKYGPNSRVGNLGNMGDNIDSMRLDDHG